tara:strand:+ start:1500 stop:1805 length:306 start_codon:yes stop_codon:yes gene_type:complete
VLARYLILTDFDDIVVKLLHPTAGRTDQVVMVVPIIEFENRAATLEIVSDNQTRRLELRKHAIDRSQPDVLSRFEQGLVDILGAHVANIGGLECLQDAYAR